MANGYMEITVGSRPSAQKSGRIKTHRLVAESYLGRYLKPKEVVHHINENNHDNKIENLIVFENEGYHQRYHQCTSGRDLGIVLYGPSCAKIKAERYKKLAEKTKRDMGIN
jgi:tetrahydromethanopterin S-methyltransferase subunit G